MQRINIEDVWDEWWLGDEVDPLEIVQEIDFRLCKQTVYAQPGICHG